MADSGRHAGSLNVDNLFWSIAKIGRVHLANKCPRTTGTSIQDPNWKVPSVYCANLLKFGNHFIEIHGAAFRLNSNDASTDDQWPVASIESLSEVLRTSFRVGCRDA